VEPFGHVAIVGVGLIGGSIGLAVKKRRLADHVTGIGRRQTPSLQIALERGAIDVATSDLTEGVAEADLTILCVPVRLIPQFASEAMPAFRPNALLTDAGSTKARIVAEVESVCRRDVLFVGSHPMAGSEKRGPAHADPDLFEQAQCILTPTAKTDAYCLARVQAFWEALGCEVERMSPREHDRAIARASHLAHLTAAALVNTQVPESLRFTAQGFTDTTRIASSDPILWADICSHNRKEIVEAIDALIEQLQQLAQAMAAGNREALLDQLDRAKRTRNQILLERGGPGPHEEPI